MRVNRQLYTPGEIISDELTDEQMAWFTKKDAIGEVAPEAATAAAPKTEETEETEGAEETTTEIEETTETAPGADETEECEYDDGPPPEIDIMEGVVLPQKKAPQRKRTAAKK